MTLLDTQFVIGAVGLTSTVLAAALLAWLSVRTLRGWSRLTATGERTIWRAAMAAAVVASLLQCVGAPLVLSQWIEQQLRADCWTDARETIQLAASRPASLVDAELEFNETAESDLPVAVRSGTEEHHEFDRPLADRVVGDPAPPSRAAIAPFARREAERLQSADDATPEQESGPRWSNPDELPGRFFGGADLAATDPLASEAESPPRAANRGKDRVVESAGAAARQTASGEGSNAMAPRFRLPVLAFLASAAWLAGALWLAFRWLASYGRWLWRVRRGVCDAGVGERAAHLMRALGERGPLPVIRVEGLAGPAAFGVVRSCIAIPHNFEAQFEPRQQDAVLAHEVAHVVSRDPLWQALADGFAVMLWWHPGAWWLRRELLESSEFAADASAALVPDGRRLLASGLMRIARTLVGRPELAAAPMAGHLRSGLARRVTRLMQNESPHEIRRGTRWLFSTSLTVVLSGAVCCCALAQPSSRVLERSDMNLTQHPWSRSLAAATVMTFSTWATATAQTKDPEFTEARAPRADAADDDERDERRDRADREREGDRERDDDRRRGGERERDGDRERDETRRDRDREGGEREAAAEMRRLQQLREQLLERMKAFEVERERREPTEALELEGRRLKSALLEVQNRMEQIRRKLGGRERDGDRERGGDREREVHRDREHAEHAEHMEHRRERVRMAMKHLYEAGFREEAMRLERLLSADVRRDDEGREVEREVEVERERHEERHGERHEERHEVERERDRDIERREVERREVERREVERREAAHRDELTAVVRELAGQLKRMQDEMAELKAALKRQNEDRER